MNVFFTQERMEKIKKIRYDNLVWIININVVKTLFSQKKTNL